MALEESLVGFEDAVCLHWHILVPVGEPGDVIVVISFY